MDGYRVLTLGEEARTFMRESLQDGNTLASLVHELVDFEQGSITTLFDEDLDPKNALLFTSGWDIGMDDTRDYVLSVADTLRTRIGDLIWIMEEIKAEPDFPYLRRLEDEGVPMRFLGNEVYYVLSTATHMVKTIGEAIREAKTSYYALNVVAPLEGRWDLSSPRGEITLDLLRHVVERSPLVVMGAYDGEGFLVWQRHTRPKVD